jgi:hypothetical protein
MKVLLFTVPLFITEIHQHSINLKADVKPQLYKNCNKYRDGQKLIVFTQKRLTTETLCCTVFITFSQDNCDNKN